LGRRSATVTVLAMVATVLVLTFSVISVSRSKVSSSADFLGNAESNARRLVTEGRQTFRFDTFGDEAFWGDQLQLHRVVAQLSPRQALGLGLKVDAEALSPATIEAIKHGKVDLDDPAVTLELIQQHAVLGIVGSFDSKGALASIGL